MNMPIVPGRAAGPPRVPRLSTHRPGPQLYDDWLRAELFEQRLVQLTGDLDDVTAGRMSTELFTLDAAGDEPIHLQVTSRSGTVDGALALVDAIGVVGVEVRATVMGAAEGPALWAVVACDRRTAGPSARLSLTAPDVDHHGRAAELVAWADRVADQLAAVARLIEAATSLSLDEAEAALRERRWWTPEEAVAAGILHEIARPGASIHHLPRRVGFRPEG